LEGDDSGGGLAMDEGGGGGGATDDGVGNWQHMAAAMILYNAGLQRFPPPQIGLQIGHSRDHPSKASHTRVILEAGVFCAQNLCRLVEG
jgi:hypothetical protein